MSITADPWLDDRVLLTGRPESRRPVMRQRWEHLLFLHWEVDPAGISRLLPAGLEVDLFEGRAYVGLVPFTMAGVRPAGLPSVWGLSNFHETNVRTYVRLPDGRPGVWFFSLDAANVVGTMLGRFWFRLPYFYARMTLTARERAGGEWNLQYTSRRIWPGSAAVTRVEAEVTGPPTRAVAGTLEFWLAERYLLYTAGPAGSTTDSVANLMCGRVHHSAYPLQAARVLALDESAVEAAGIKRPDQPPLAHYARRVVVEVFGLEPVAKLNPRPVEA